MRTTAHFAALVLAGRAGRRAGVRAMQRVLMPETRGTSCEEVVRRLRIGWREVWAADEVRAVVLHLVAVGACERRDDGFRVRDWEAVEAAAQEGSS